MEQMAKKNEIKKMARLFKFEAGKEGREKAARKFRELDIDGNGTLDIDEFLQGAHLYNLSEAEARTWFAELDESETGCVVLCMDSFAVNLLRSSYRTRIKLI